MFGLNWPIFIEVYRNTVRCQKQCQISLCPRLTMGKRPRVFFHVHIFGTSTKYRLFKLIKLDRSLSGCHLFALSSTIMKIFEPPHDKTNKMAVRPAKTQISLGIHPVWSKVFAVRMKKKKKIGYLATLWAHSEDSDESGRMPRLIWVFAGRTVILYVLSWGGSFVTQSLSEMQWEMAPNITLPWHQTSSSCQQRNDTVNVRKLGTREKKKKKTTNKNKCCNYSKIWHCDFTT